VFYKIKVAFKTPDAVYIRQFSVTVAKKKKKKKKKNQTKNPKTQQNKNTTK
jgi:hypothetical protein